MAHGNLSKDSTKRTGYRLVPSPRNPVDPRTAFEASARLGLVRKALRQS